MIAFFYASSRTISAMKSPETIIKIISHLTNHVWAILILLLLNKLIHQYIRLQNKKISVCFSKKFRFCFFVFVFFCGLDLVVYMLIFLFAY